MKALFAASFLTVAALALAAAPAHAQQININIGQPAPRYVVVQEARPVRVYKAPKHKKSGVVLMPIGPAYYAPRGHGHGHGHGHGRH